MKKPKRTEKKNNKKIVQNKRQAKNISCRGKHHKMVNFATKCAYIYNKSKIPFLILHEEVEETNRNPVEQEGKQNDSTFTI